MEMHPHVCVQMLDHYMVSKEIILKQESIILPLVPPRTTGNICQKSPHSSMHLPPIGWLFPVKSLRVWSGTSNVSLFIMGASTTTNALPSWITLTLQCLFDATYENIHWSTLESPVLMLMVFICPSMSSMMGSYQHLVGFQWLLLRIPFATAIILHARRIGIDITIGSIHHVGHDNLMEFRIYRKVRDFCIYNIINFISSKVGYLVVQISPWPL